MAMLPMRYHITQAALTLLGVAFMAAGFFAWSGNAAVPLPSALFVVAALLGLLVNRRAVRHEKGLW